MTMWLAACQTKAEMESTRLPPPAVSTVVKVPVTPVSPAVTSSHTEISIPSTTESIPALTPAQPPTLDLDSLPPNVWVGKPTYPPGTPNAEPTLFWLEFDPTRWAKGAQYGEPMVGHRSILGCHIVRLPKVGSVGWPDSVEHSFKSLGPVEFGITAVSDKDEGLKFINYVGGVAGAETTLRVEFVGETENCIKAAEEVLATLRAVTPAPNLWVDMPTEVDYRSFLFSVEFDVTLWNRSPRYLGWGLEHRFIKDCRIGRNAHAGGLPEDWSVDNSNKELGAVNYEVIAVSHEGEGLRYINYMGRISSPARLSTTFTVVVGEEIEVCVKDAEAVLATLRVVSGGP